MIRVLHFLKKVSIHFVIWFVAFTFWGLMRQLGQDVVDQPDLTIVEWTTIYLILAMISGVIFGTVDTLLPRSIFKRTSFGRVVLLRTGIYSVIFVFLTIIGISTFSFFDQQDLSLRDQYHFIISKEMLLLLFYCFLVVFLVHFIKELDRKFGPGNLKKMLLGSFYKPKVEDRVFMFLDLKSSTSIAEKLGHIKYSQLIQDCFSDLEVVFIYKSEVYQYVGDEVVLTWTRNNGITQSNCLSAFFAYRNRIRTRSDYYLSNYNLVPEFKAGVHVGQIVVAEVGEEKREIAYHGDTINTAARLQSECGVRGEEVLISRELTQLVSTNRSYIFIPKGEVQLKGKLAKTEIYTVKENENY